MQNILEIENSVRNQTQTGDKSFHSWYQFVLGYPPHLVRYYIYKFGITPGHFVLDPFCGTGTTNVECKKLNIHSLGLEANPVVYFASRVKTNWQTSPIGTRAPEDGLCRITLPIPLTLTARPFSVAFLTASRSDSPVNTGMIMVVPLDLSSGPKVT